MRDCPFIRINMISFTFLHCLFQMWIIVIVNFEGGTEEELENSETQGKSRWGKLLQFSKKYGTSRPLIATWYFEKLFWTVIYTTGYVFTAINCWGLIQQYTSDITQYNVNLLFNKSINLPDACLCFYNPYFRPLYYSSNLNNVDVKLVLTQDLENYFNQTTAIRSREEFFDQTTTWPESLKFAAFLYISMMTSYEMNSAHDISISDDKFFLFQTSNRSGQSSKCIERIFK
jgi:hypothetical protein